MENKRTFNPGIAIPPGETLLEVLNDREMTQKELAERIGVTPKHINKIVKGTAPISHEISIKLEIVLGIKASFWNNLESKFQETKARLDSLAIIENEERYLNLIPYNEIAKLGWVAKSNNKIEKVINLRNFFGVASLDSVPTIQQAAFRKSKNSESDSYAIATWITQAELLAKDIETLPYKRKNLEKAMYEFRDLTKLPAKAAIPKLKKICAQKGIALVILPHINKTYLNGVTKWLTPDQVLIALSLKGSYEDIFWFTFFHELGHVLQEKKSEVFVDGEEYFINELEAEADKFALTNLLPESQYNEFVTNKHYLDVAKLRSFAEDNNIHIGIVVGRLMKDNYIEYGNRPYVQLRRKISY